MFPLRSSWPRAWPGGADNLPALDQLKELAGAARSELGEGAQLRIQHLRRGRQRVSPRGTSERGVTPECQPGAKPYPEAMKVLEGLKAIEPGSAVPVTKLGLPVTGRKALLLVFWKST